MTKQQEIRAVIDLYADDGCMYPDRVCNAFGDGYCSSSKESYRCLMHRLGELGVVIKVDRELPYECICGGYDFEPFEWSKDKQVAHCCECDAYNRGLMAGYVAVEPLIEGE